jgi:acid phosphatase (class A)
MGLAYGEEVLRHTLMIRALRCFTVLGLSLSLGPFAQAQISPSSTAAPTSVVAKPKPPPTPDPHWLTHDEILAIVNKVPPPPAPGSPADQADLQTEIDVQNTRTPERSQQAKIDASLSPTLFLQQINPTLNSKNDPKLFLLLKQLGRIEGTVNGMAKSRFKRPRPFVAHGDVIHPLGTIGGSSYPSGHSTNAECTAVILAQIFPSKAELMLQIGDRMCESRVVMGVHYTTDIKEGKTDGEEIAGELLAKPAFEQALGEVKTEVEQQQLSP